MLPTNAIRLLELRDVKISKLLTDSAVAPTYGAPVDLVGGIKVTVTPKADTKKLKGDSTTIDVYQKITEVDIDLEVAVLSLDALVVIQGGSITTTGVAPFQKTKYSMKSTDASPGYFKVEGQWTYAGEGIADAHFVLYKCKATDLPPLEVNDASGNFGTVKIKGSALPCISNAEWYDIILNETLTPIGGVLQVETATVAGTVTTAGDATITVTGAGITGSPLALAVAVAINDSASVVAQKIREAIALDASISTLYAVGGAGTAVVLTANNPLANDATLNIAIANGTCAGLTAQPTSANTTAGQLPS